MCGTLVAGKCLPDAEKGAWCWASKVLWIFCILATTQLVTVGGVEHTDQVFKLCGDEWTWFCEHVVWLRTARGLAVGLCLCGVHVGRCIACHSIVDVLQVQLY